ncbi:MAG: VWA domain-containing protein, partial [Clostridia bacterium]|nr:VWA domain-containing protein [Clostridia bacterium]
MKLLSKDEWKGFVNSRKLDTANIVTVKVTDGENACFNVPVKLLSGDEVIYTGKTDINGRAYLFGNITGNDKTADAVSVGEQTVALDGKTEIEISAAEAGVKVTALDLMLMIDTTGSMGDELEYIKAELYDVVERVAKAGESISIRVSVNFYRDEGDDYTVKFFDFREDINECIEQLKEQSAYGGGDYPEAVHTALDNAVSGHDWREEAVKLCFIVLDAPPHSESEIQEVNVELLKTVKTAAEQGIRIIPVASSGVDGETEFLLRSWALMTGGTYIFITNDSGIGGGHKEAEVGE